MIGGNTMDLVSIIIPVYNVEKYLERCILSVINQSYKDIEIILVNDGSTDDSLKICQKYETLDKRIILIDQKNAGLSGARNSGLKYASGEYIVFIDSDDYVSVNYIKNLLLAAKEKNLDIVQCFYVLTNDKTDSYPNDTYNSKDVKIISKIDALNKRKYKVTAWAKIYKKEILDHFQFREGIIHEDDDSYYKLIDRANSIGVLDEVLYYYYMAPNSIIRNHKKEKSTIYIDIYQDRIKYFKEKQNIELLEGSYARFCLVLLLSYSLAISNGINMKDKDMFLELFRENYYFIKKSQYVSFKDKVLFKLFNVMPNIVGHTIGMIKNIHKKRKWQG